MHFGTGEIRFGHLDEPPNPTDVCRFVYPLYPPVLRCRGGLWYLLAPWAPSFPPVVARLVTAKLPIYIYKLGAVILTILVS